MNSFRNDIRFFREFTNSDADARALMDTFNRLLAEEVKRRLPEQENLAPQGARRAGRLR